MNTHLRYPRWIEPRIAEAMAAGENFKMGILLYDGIETLPLGEGLWAAPLSTLWGKQGGRLGQPGA